MSCDFLGSSNILNQVRAKACASACPRLLGCCRCWQKYELKTHEAHNFYLSSTYIIHIASKHSGICQVKLFQFTSKPYNSILFKNIENNKRWTVLRSMQRERSVEINNKNNNNNNNRIKCTNGSAEAVKQKIWKEFRDSNKLNREWSAYILGDVYHRWIFAHKWLHIRTLNATFDDSTSASIKRTLLLFRN